MVRGSHRMGRVVWCGAVPASAGEKIVLNVVTAGDTNMHELQKSVFGPAFSKQYPSVEINAVEAARAIRAVG